MSVSRPTYHSKLYREFKAIQPDAIRDVVRFYDENEAAICALEFEEYFELLVSYVNCLFHIGRYRQHLLMVDTVIETSIQRNIFLFNGKDLFFEMLTCKGLSYLYIYEYAKAEDIFRQLLRIKPETEEVAGYLEKSIRYKGAAIQNWSRALSIGLLFVAALVIALEILLIRPFYELYIHHFEISRTLLFALACLVLAGGEWAHRRQSRHKTRTFLRRVKEEKTTRSSL